MFFFIIPPLYSVVHTLIVLPYSSVFLSLNELLLSIYIERDKLTGGGGDEVKI